MGKQSGIISREWVVSSQDEAKDIIDYIEHRLNDVSPGNKSVQRGNGTLKGTVKGFANYDFKYHMRKVGGNNILQLSGNITVIAQTPAAIVLWIIFAVLFIWTIILFLVFLFLAIAATAKHNEARFEEAKDFFETIFLDAEHIVQKSTSSSFSAFMCH